MKTFLQHIGIKFIRDEGDNQLLCECPWCGKPKLYVDKATGLWKCQRNCDSGNLYQLADKLTDMDSKTIMKLLKQSGLSGTDSKPMAPMKQGKPKLPASKCIPLIGDELEAFCKLKGVSVEAYQKVVGVTWRHKDHPWAIIPGYNPSQPEHACAAMRVHLEGKLIPIGKDGNEEKYPLIAGSRHGLIGVPSLLKEKPESMLFIEAWRGVLAAVELGFHATASTGGASCFKPEWLPLFKGRKVAIAMDADEPGVFAAQRAALAIWNVAKEVKIVTIPFEVTKDHGKDTYDWIKDL